MKGEELHWIKQHICGQHYNKKIKPEVKLLQGDHTRDCAKKIINQQTTILLALPDLNLFTRCGISERKHLIYETKLLAEKNII